MIKNAIHKDNMISVTNKGIFFECIFLIEKKDSAKKYKRIGDIQRKKGCLKENSAFLTSLKMSVIY